MQQVQLPGGSTIPSLGLGTWRLGEARSRRAAEVASVRHALDIGYRLVDTAEMYGEGGSEEVVGEALAQAFRTGGLRREEVFVVTKVYPHNASRKGAVAACDRSRRRLGLDRVDLYLLHWRGAHPLRETVAGFRDLVAAGHVARWGVSNFDVDDLEELARVAEPSECAANQVWYSLGERGPEFALLPWMRERGMPLMAYSPIDEGRMAGDPRLREIGAGKGWSPAQVALAWAASRPGVVAIPKALSEKHQRENLAAAGIELDAGELRRIDAAFPPPRGKSALAMI
jgi:diketogulonate reductase-like aldo/keto reductase